MKYSIVNYRDTQSNSDFRIDAEYWRPDFIENAALVSGDRKISHFVERDIPNIKSSPVDGDFQYLEISNIFLDRPEYQTTKVQPGEAPDRAHYILRKNDVAVSTVRPNRNAVAFIQDDDIVGSSGLSVLRANSIEPKYLYLFCKTDYFINCLMRANKASMYPAASNHDVLNVPLFVPSDSFLSCVLPFVDDAFEMVHASNRKYEEAQYVLLSDIGLAGWQPYHHPWFIKHYADLQNAERIDADYFQPKYDEIVDAVQNYSGGWGMAGDLLNMKAKNHSPDGAREYQYIELANITENGEVAGCTVAQGRDLPSRARCEVAENDVIISSVEGSLEKIAMIREEYSRDSLCSTGFHVVNSDILNSETLLVFLKSPAGRLQLNKGCSGTILTAISEDEFRKIALPKISQATQTQIAQKITESFALSKQSKRLLECAKRAVEIAIEKGERAAVEWLEREAG